VDVLVRVEPLLHLLSLEVDIADLTATTHSEVAVKVGNVGLGEAGGDDVEGVVEVEDVVVESEVTAARREKGNVSEKSGVVKRCR
jgi:hypothetical protein